MNELRNVMVIEGSRTDDEPTNIFLKILRDCKVTYQVKSASAHWHAGDIYTTFLLGIEEDIIVFIGGMSLVGPGLISAIYRNKLMFEKNIIGIPTDEAARSACEDLPMGVPLLTPGLNTISAKHSIINGALAVAKLVLMQTRNNDIRQGLIDWFDKTRKKKPIEDIELNKHDLITPKEGRKTL